MREYGKIVSRFWTGGSGAALRGHPIAQLVASYLFTAPAANPIGIFYLPLVTMAHELGLEVQEVELALRELQRGNVATFDPAESLVWVPEMARVSFGEKLGGGDKRRPWILRELHQHRKHPFHALFVRRYAEPYGLPAGAEAPSAPPASPFDGASSVAEMEQGAGSREQEQQQDPPVVPPVGDLAKPGQVELAAVGPKPTRGRSGRRAVDMSNRPESWKPNEGHYELAGQQGLSRAEVLEQVPRWTDHHLAKGQGIKDFDASFRTWLGNVKRFGGARGRPADDSRSTLQRPAKEGEFQWKTGEEIDLR